MTTTATATTTKKKSLDKNVVLSFISRTHWLLENSGTEAALCLSSS